MAAAVAKSPAPVLATNRPAVSPFGALTTNAPLPRLINSTKLGTIALGDKFQGGSFSKVFRGLCRQGDVAVKVISPHELEPRFMGFISSELWAMRSLHHRNIVDLHDIVERDDHRLYVVMRLAKGGDLRGYVNKFGPFSERHSAAIFVQLLDAVQYCHSQGMVHRDLKLDNILVDDRITSPPTASSPAPRVLLADFGFASSFSWAAPLLSDSVGSPPYAASELHLARSYYGPEVDCFALGVILYALVRQRLPFVGTPQQVRQAILSGTYIEPEKASASLKKLLRRMLEPDPKLRCSLDEVQQSEWLRQNIPAQLPPLQLAEATVASSPMQLSPTSPMQRSESHQHGASKARTKNAMMSPAS